VRSSSGEYPLVAVIGPTGAGKSALALRLAAEFGGEIVNCDSVQLYRGFDIGTAKPTAAERALAPHHLIDALDPGEISSAGDYAGRARAVVGEIAGRGRLPIVCGGTGFYLRALLDGLAEAPSRDPALRERLARRERRRPGSLHRLLRRFDAASARRIHPRDVNKTTRAVEVCLAARRPMSALFASGRNALEGFRALKIGLNPPREPLYRRLDERCRRMFDQGLAEEVVALLKGGVPPDAKPFESIGYAEALAFASGRTTRDEALALARRNTRRYAKRQRTWFLREPGVEWFEAFGEDTQLQQNVLETCKRFLDSFTEITPNS
jgi:tRNA dimethylallyltransferase